MLSTSTTPLQAALAPSGASFAILSPFRGEGMPATRPRARIDAAERSLGEHGETCWNDDAPDWNRYLAKNTPYAAWFAGLGAP